jgi:hypothetical protein
MIVDMIRIDHPKIACSLQVALIKTKLPAYRYRHRYQAVFLAFMDNLKPFGQSTSAAGGKGAPTQIPYVDLCTCTGASRLATDGIQTYAWLSLRMLMVLDCKKDVGKKSGMRTRRSP